MFERDLFEGTDRQRTPGGSTFDDPHPRARVGSAQDERARTIGGNAHRVNLAGTLGLYADAERAIDSPADAHRRGRGRPPHPSEPVHRRAERRLSGQECNRRSAALRVHPIGAAPGDQGGLHGRDCRVGGVSGAAQVRHPRRRHDPHPVGARPDESVERVCRGRRDPLHIQHVTGQRDAHLRHVRYLGKGAGELPREVRTRSLCRGRHRVQFHARHPVDDVESLGGNGRARRDCVRSDRLERLTRPFDEAREQMGGQASRRVPARIGNEVPALCRREVEISEGERGREGRPTHEDHVFGAVDAPLSVFTHEAEGARHGRGGDAGQHARRVDAGHAEHGDRHVHLGSVLGSGGDGGGRVRVIDQDFRLRLP